MEDKLPSLKELYTKFLIKSNEKNILEDKLLIPKELIKYVQELNKIIITKENNSEEIKSFINNYLIIDFLNSDQEAKKLVLNEFKIYEKYYKKIKNKANYYKEIKIIRDFNECIQNIVNNKFFIIYEDALKDINLKEKDSIYYLKFNNKSYIFFEKEAKILQLEKDNDYSQNKLFILDEYKLELEYKKYIQTEVKKNKNIKDYENKIKEFYLINPGWIENKSNEFKPQIIYSPNKIFKFINDFSFIEKESNEIYFNYLISNNIFNQNKDILISKLFFVNFQNNIPENKKLLLIAILDNDKNPIIYFYSIKNYYYNFIFFIQFNDENLLNEEIEKNIKRKGIGKYIYDFGINFSNSGEYDLINIDLKTIGKLYNYQKNYREIYYYFNYLNKEVKNIEKSGFLIGILYCLLNIKPLTDFFSKTNKPFKLIDENSTTTKFYYKIVQDLLWNFDDKDENINKLYIEFMEKIKDISKNNDIFNNMEGLINWLLLELHNDLLEDNEGKKVKKYKLFKNFSEIIVPCVKNEKDKIINDFYSNHNSIIRKLFFFELELMNNCNNKECLKSKKNNNIFSYSYNSFLNIEFNQIDEEIKKGNRVKLDIYNLIDYTFNKNVNICEECFQKITIKKKFYSCPQYLIICTNKKSDMRFRNKEKLNIINYVYSNNNLLYLNEIEYDYELISFIIDNKTFFCKSLENNSWYKYEIATKPQKINMLELVLEAIPYLLIYKKIKNKE